MLVKNIAILFSGRGSNMKALLEKVHNKSFNGVKICCKVCICNNPNAAGLEIPQKYNIKTIIINHKEYQSRNAFDEALVATLKEFELDLVILAGFMRILTPTFTSQIKAINLHPSILPLFKGANAIKESFHSQMCLGGVSVHFVSEELDGGKLIAQRAFEREDEMSLEKWEEKIHQIEHELLSECVIKLLTKEKNV